MMTTVRIGRGFALFCVLLLPCGIVAADPRVWTGFDHAFSKPDHADWTDPANQDRITQKVWITRGDTRGVFNPAEESFYPTSPPSGTEWAYGTAADWQSLVFRSWEKWHGSNPPSSVGRDAVLHIIEDDVYIDIRFTSWTEGGQGGGFAYERATEGTPGEMVWSGSPITFEKADYADWTDPANQDRITDNVLLTRADKEGLFNRAAEPDYDASPPAGTEWAYGSAADWQSLVFRSWETWHGSTPPTTVGKDAVLHLIEDDVYIDIKFLSWTQGGKGGGFKYERATEGSPGEKVWSGNRITFEKADYADWTAPANQDRITEHVWLSRADTKGLFNRAAELAYKSSPPAGTEWAYGTATDWESLDFTSWHEWTDWDPGSTVDNDAVLHLIEDDIYLDIRFTSWTVGAQGGGFSYVRAVNAPPKITAGPTAMPDSTLAGVPVDFSVGASDINGDPLTYDWDYGDGASGTGASTSHAYASPGMYEATVTVSDGLLSRNGSVSVTVADRFELTKLKGKLNFKKGAKDSLALKGVLDLPDGFVPAGQELGVRLGGVASTLSLDAKGKAKTDAGKAQLKYSKKSGAWTLTVTLKKGDFAATWADDGLVNDTVKGVPVDLATVVTVGGMMFLNDGACSYTGKAGKSGKFSLGP